MNCPYCGKEMEKGYIDQQQVGIPLQWYSGQRGDDFLWSKRKTIKLTSAFTPLTAYYCAACGKLMADVEKK